MKNPLSILAASSALTLAIIVPTLAAMPFHVQDSICGRGTCAVVIDSHDQSTAASRVSDDDGKGEDAGRIGNRRSDEDCDEDGGDDDDDGCNGTGAMQNPAPAGTVTPPANGLFGNGTPPAAVTH